MQIFHTINDWLAFQKTLPASLAIGFVPTMGNLHAGHQSLYLRSKKDNQATMASIFINPTQFDQIDDYRQYPKTMAADLALLQDARVDYCLIPSETDMYKDAYRYNIVEHELSQLMEGKHRPGHFTGMLTVVMKLLHLVKPKRAYFGEKDYQQYLLIRDMAAAFFMDIEIIQSPTIRETSGLAYSSRNARLNANERLLAEQFANIFHRPGSCEQITQQLQDIGIQVDYVMDYNKRRFGAVVIGAIRLIDNYALNFD